jgi:hypothetical protein
MGAGPRHSLLRLRNGVVLAVFGVVLTSCLFPSFDKFERGGGASEDAGGGGRSRDAATPEGAAPERDAAIDAAAPREIVCGDLRCTVPDENCCTTIGGPDCQPNATTFCTSVQGGQLFECDGDEDCAEGQTCCHVAEEKAAKCRGSCAGQELCNGPSARCPAGKSCTGKVEIFRACE